VNNAGRRSKGVSPLPWRLTGVSPGIPWWADSSLSGNGLKPALQEEPAISIPLFHAPFRSARLSRAEGIASAY
jgi:hypothetical protein